jgi:hypothetical protein
MQIGKASGPSCRNASSKLGECKTERETSSRTQGFKFCIKMLGSISASLCLVWFKTKSVGWPFLLFTSLIFSTQPKRTKSRLF